MGYTLYRIDIFALNEAILKNIGKNITRWKSLTAANTTNVLLTRSNQKPRDALEWVIYRYIVNKYLKWASEWVSD